MGGCIITNNEKIEKENYSKDGEKYINLRNMKVARNSLM